VLDFVFQWLWYLGAFVAGAVLAWLITLLAVKPRSAHEAAAALPGSREIGARQ
jgi:uncharacterized membrane protein ArfB